MGGTWRAVILGLGVAGMALVYFANELLSRVGEDRGAFVIALAAAGLGVLGLWWAFSRLVRHFRDLERLTADLAALRHRSGLSDDWEARGDELGRLGAALADHVRRERRGAGGGGRLGIVAAALEEPLLVLSEFGRITLVNPAAARLFGPGAGVGTDVYGLIERPGLFRAIEHARGAGQPVAAVLRGPGGAELPAQVVDFGLQSGVAVVFPFRPSAQPLLPAGPSASEPPPAPGAADWEALAALSMVALWVGTEAGRVVEVGTVRLSGARVFRTVSLDVPINPGEAPVPGARPFATAWPVIAEALHHAVAVGVDVDSALAALHAERERAGLPAADDPPALDLRRLAAALDPESVGKDLPGLAAHFGVAPHPGGPHALLTAELAAALLRRLAERGVQTLGEARALGGGIASALPPGQGLEGTPQTS